MLHCLIAALPGQAPRNRTPRNCLRIGVGSPIVKTATQSLSCSRHQCKTLHDCSTRMQRRPSGHPCPCAAIVRTWHEHCAISVSVSCIARRRFLANFSGRRQLAERFRTSCVAGAVRPLHAAWPLPDAESSASMDACMHCEAMICPSVQPCRPNRCRRDGTAALLHAACNRTSAC